MLVARRHQLKEMVRLGWRQFGVADLIDHQHTGAGVATQPLAHQTRDTERSPGPQPDA